MAIPSRIDYEKQLYHLQGTYPEVVSSSLHLYSSSALTAIVRGEIILNNGLKIRVLEILNFKEEKIEGYSYAVYDGELKIRWYDPQPHPENPNLVETFPHHYHTEPNIKRNRQPAYGISFISTNFATLIQDCLALK